MSLYPTTIKTGDDYASVDDILNCSDLAEATITVPGWKKAGKPLIIRVRAPSLGQKELISMESLRKDGTVDSVKEVEATLRECIIVPKFTISQASQLRTKNGNVAEQIARFCLNLGALDQEQIDAIVQGLAGAKPATEPDEDTSPAGD